MPLCSGARGLIYIILVGRAPANSATQTAHLLFRRPMPSSPTPVSTHGIVRGIGEYEDNIKAIGRDRDLVVPTVIRNSANHSSHRGR